MLLCCVRLMGSRIMRSQSHTPGRARPYFFFIFRSCIWQDVHAEEPRRLLVVVPPKVAEGGVSARPLRPSFHL